jgi:MFS family permease
VIGGVLLFMKPDLGLDTSKQQELTVSIVLLGAIAGALIAGWSADRCGRRRTKIVSGCVYVTGAIGCALAQSYWQILAGSFWLGIAEGTAPAEGTPAGSLNRPTEGRLEAPGTKTRQDAYYPARTTPE